MKCVVDVRRYTARHESLHVHLEHYRRIDVKANGKFKLTLGHELMKRFQSATAS